MLLKPELWGEALHTLYAGLRGLRSQAFLPQQLPWSFSLFFWPHWVLVAARRLSLDQGLLFVAVSRLLITVVSLVVEHWL